jgi:manganese-dependent inorganic pyrophosphatase
MKFDSGITPSRKIAGLMCSAIISDTLKFKSPTCTYLDRVTAEKLAEMAGLDIETYAFQMFKAGSNLKGKTPREILCEDFKEFEFNKGRVGIGQVSTIDIESLDEMRDGILSFMTDYCKDRKFDLVILLITDILNQGFETLFVGALKEIVGKAFGVQTKENSVYLPGVVSRKKQVIPNIAGTLENML